MTLDVSSFSDPVENSLDLVERALDAADWTHERDGYNSVHCIAPTCWGDLGGVFTMAEAPDALHFSVTLDVKPTPTRRNEVSELIMLMNEKLWLGHFDYWLQDGMILFRHTIPMAGRAEPDANEISAVIDAATQAVERFTPSLNYVIWAGKTAEEAMETAMFETVGEA